MSAIGTTQCHALLCLYLSAVQVYRDDPIHAHRLEHVGDIGGGDWLSPKPSVLSGVPVEGDHRSDALGRRPDMKRRKKKKNIQQARRHGVQLVEGASFAQIPVCCTLSSKALSTTLHPVLIRTKSPLLAPSKQLSPGKTYASNAVPPCHVSGTTTKHI